MKKQDLWISAGLAAFVSMFATQGCGRALAQTGGSAGAARDIQLTIYKEDFALVHEDRAVALGEGANLLHMENVSKSLDPNTVIFDWAGSHRAPDVTSETYDLGVRSGGSLLKRLEGKPVEMLWNSQEGKPGDKISGTLESTQDGGFVIRSGDKLFVNPNGTIVASGEQSLVTMPQLSAEVTSPAKQDATMGFAYQTRGMSWNSDYVGRFTAEGDAMDLECWATLENHTGVDYPNAKITLVAGSPNRAVTSTEMKAPGGAGFNGNISDPTLAPSRQSYLAESAAVGELYAYKVPSAASVGQEQMNRVKMIAVSRVPIKKDYSIRMDTFAYAVQNPVRQNAQLAISFINDEKSGLGMPLPAGAVRIYDSTSSDSTAFIGAAGIGDTPKKQDVNLTLSKVFDVYSDSRTVSSTRINKHTIRLVFETVLHNEKKAAVDVRVVGNSYGKKHLVSESAVGKQIDSATRQWIIRVDPGTQKTLTWTADYGG